MKLLFTFLSSFIFSISTSGQTDNDIFYNEITFFLTENGSPLTQAEFEEILKNNAAKYHRWDQMENDSIRIARLIPRKEEIKVSYPDFFEAIEGITNTSLPGNPVMVIFYDYLDDICSPASAFNQWGTLRIRREKRFSDNLKRRIEQDYPNVIAYHLFEPGIYIEPSQVLKQYFFIDKNQYFRQNLFRTQSTCGSIAIIKPGGKTVIYHGETSIPILAESLQD